MNILNNLIVISKNPKIVCIDLETTGLSAYYNEILEICMMELDSNLNITQNKLHTYVQIEHPETFSTEAQNVNKIKLEDIKTFCPIEDARELIITWLNDISSKSKIVPLGHNYKYFDIFFLKKFLNKYTTEYNVYEKYFYNPLDLMDLVKYYNNYITHNVIPYKQIESFSLQNISKYCKVINENEHSAFDDVKTTAICYKKIHDYLKSYD